MFLIDRWDWADADREMLRAISLDPQNGELYYLRACLLQAVNRDAEAIELGKKAMEIDPFSRPYALASLYQYARQFDATLKEIRLRLEATPNNLDLLGLEMDTFRRMGNYKEAVDVWARWNILNGRSSVSRGPAACLGSRRCPRLRSLAAWPASPSVEESLRLSCRAGELLCTAW